MSKNTTMTVGERIVKDIVLVLGTLGVGGVIASKCGGKSVDKAKVIKTNYGYNIENSIARVVLFSAKKGDGNPALWMMYEIKQPSIFSSLPYQVVKKLLRKQFTPIKLLYKGSMGITGRELPSPFKAVFPLAGFPSEIIDAIINHIDCRDTLPKLSGPLNDKKLDPENVLDNLHAAIVLGFGEFIERSSSYLQGQLQPLNTGDSKTTHDLLNMFLNTQKFAKDDDYTPPIIPRLQTSILYSYSLQGLMDDIIVNNKIAFFPLRHYYEVSRELNKLKAFNYILSDEQRRSTILKVLAQPNAFDDDDALLASQNSNASTLYNYLTAKNPSGTLKEIAKPSSTEILRVFEDVVTASEALKKEIDDRCANDRVPSDEEKIDFVCKIEAQLHNLCLCEEFYSGFECNTDCNSSTAASTAKRQDGKGKVDSFTTIKEEFGGKVKEFSGKVSAFRADLEVRSKVGSNNDDESDSDSEFNFGDDDDD